MVPSVLEASAIRPLEPPAASRMPVQLSHVQDLEGLETLFSYLAFPTYVDSVRRECR
jgi:hypothetical protein